MPKPWEKYATPAPAAAAGPWAKYGPGGGSTVAPDFSAVRSDVRIPDSARIPERKIERLVDALPSSGPASRALLEGGEDFTRAALHHAGSALHGGAQLVEHGVGWLADQVLPEEPGNLSGLITGKKAEPKTLAGRARRAIEETIAEDDAALRAREAAYQAQVPDSVASTAGAVAGAVAPFLLSAGRLGGAQVGNITGRIGAMVGPGTEKALRAIGLGATEGGVGAATTPVLGDDFAAEKLAQTGVGTAVGGALPVVGQVLRAGKPVVDYLARFTDRGATRAAGGQIRDEASNISGLMVPAPSALSGVRRTLAEESQDAGVSRLQQHARGQAGGGTFADIATENNAARVDALRKIAGDEDAIEAAIQRRNATSAPLREAAENSGALVDTSRLVGGVDRAIEGLNGRPLVQHALRDLRDLLYRPATAAEKKIPGWPDMVPIDDVRTLYNVRKTIGDWLSSASDKPYKQAAQRELLEARDLLDQEIADASPEFAQYLDAFRAGSRDVNRLQFGRELLEGGAGKNTTDALGNPILTPNAFGGQTATAQKLQRTAKTATGFNKADPQTFLKPEDMTTILAIRDDLNRVATVTRQGLGQGSPTKPLQDIGDRVAGNIVGKLTFGIGDILDKAGNARVNEKLIRLLQNPEEARAVLRSLPAKDAATLAEVLARLSGGAGAAAAQTQEPEIDVVGGNIAPRAEVARNNARYAR